MRKFKVGDKVIYVGRSGREIEYGELLEINHLNDWKDDNSHRNYYGVGKIVLVHERELILDVISDTPLFKAMNE